MCVREREKERKRERDRERQRQRERESGERINNTLILLFYWLYFLVPDRNSEDSPPFR